MKQTLKTILEAIKYKIDTINETVNDIVPTEEETFKTLADSNVINLATDANGNIFTGANGKVFAFIKGGN